MLFKGSPTITSDKIMLPKHQALAKAWDMDKQKTWGELTNMAIVMVSDMLKKQQFSTIRDLYVQMAEIRGLIGAILSHAPEVGKLGRGYSRTPIEDHPDSGYKDLYPEFKSWVEDLLVNKDSEHISLNGDGLTLKGMAKIPNSEESVEYIRSSVYGKENFEIIHSQDQMLLMSQADDLFKRLNGAPLEKQEKQEIIEEIYFYLADAMPCIRGAGSIAQMLFYALEDAYIGQMRYLGKMASKFGHEQGLTPDLAAMLSLDVKDFKDYLNNFVIDKGITVKKEMPYIDIKAIEPQKILSDIQNTKIAIEKFNATFKDSFFDNIKKKTMEPMLRAVLNLEKLSEKSADDRHQFGYFQMFLTHLKQTLAANEICYPQLYEYLDNKQDWPKPELSTDTNIFDDIDRTQFLNSVIFVTDIVHDYCSAVGRLYGWEGDTHHVATHYTAKNLIGISHEFNNAHKEKNHNLNQYFLACESIINNQKSGFGHGIDELIDMLTIIGEDKKKNIPQEQTETKIYDKIRSNYNQLIGNNRYHEDSVKKVVRAIYFKSEEINTNLKNLAPFYNVLKLKNEKADDFLNVNKQKSPRLKK